MKIVSQLHIEWEIVKKKCFFNPPLTFWECYVDGKLDIARYFLYRRRLEENEDAMAMVSEIYFKVKSKRKRKAETMSSSVCKKPRVHSRSVKRHRILFRKDDGTLEELKPKDTIWYRLYVASPPRNKRVHDLFRTRFRVPYSAYLTLLEDISNHPSFSEYHRCDCIGHRSTLLPLLILGSLRYLGRSWTFDDLEESTAISRESHRVFFSQIH